MPPRGLAEAGRGDQGPHGAAWRGELGDKGRSGNVGILGSIHRNKRHGGISPDGL